MTSWRELLNAAKIDFLYGRRRPRMFSGSLPSLDGPDERGF
jgi:hypothetical protein